MPDWFVQLIGRDGSSFVEGVDVIYATVSNWFDSFDLVLVQNGEPLLAFNGPLTNHEFMLLEGHFAHRDKLPFIHVLHWLESVEHAEIHAKNPEGLLTKVITICAPIFSQRTQFGTTAARARMIFNQP